MHLLIPRESAAGERRVSATPETVRRLAARGLKPVVARGAGAAAGFPDHDYEAAGAALVDPEAMPWEQAGVVLCVAPPANGRRAANGSRACVPCMWPIAA